MGRLKPLITKITVQLLLFCFLITTGMAQSHQVPVPGFYLSGLCYGTVTQFINATLPTGTALTYTWSIFELGNASPVFQSNAKDISFLFPSKATYTVKLVADDGHHHNPALIRVLKVDTLTRAAFDINGCKPHFSNLSSCATSFVWDFGDGSTSNENSLYHTYSKSGQYTTKLVVSNGQVKDSASSDIFYEANDLTGNFTHRIKGDTVYFTIADTLVTHDSTVYNWLWGDGNKNTYKGEAGKRPKHVYPKIGRDSSYTVFLLERTPCYDGFGEGKVLIRDSIPVFETRIFPNPLAEGEKLQIVTNRKKELEKISFTSSVGIPQTFLQVIQRPNGVDLDLSNLPPGMYLLKFSLGDDVVLKKIIKR